MIITELFQYQKMKIWDCIWKENLIPVLLIIILMLIWKLGRQIWAYSLFLMSIRQSQAMKQATKQVFENNMHHHENNENKKTNLKNWKSWK